MRLEAVVSTMREVHDDVDPRGDRVGVEVCPEHEPSQGVRGAELMALRPAGARLRSVGGHDLVLDHRHLAAAQRGVHCFTYTPQAIKKAVCGSGGAGKEQVQRMVGTLLGLPEPPTPDHAADALAVAICHGGGTGRQEAIEAAEATPAATAERLVG